MYSINEINKINQSENYIFINIFYFLNFNKYK